MARKTPSKKFRRCVYCGAQAPVVWVHGHGQCASCGINVEECCRGEQCEHGIGKKKKSRHSTE